jgi:hypothetical protein
VNTGRFANDIRSFSQVQEDLLNDGLVDVDGETGAFSLHRLVQAQVTLHYVSANRSDLY